MYKDDGPEKALVKDNEIKERWIEYFNKILNKDSIRGLKMRVDTLLVGHTFYILYSEKLDGFFYFFYLYYLFFN